jgi:MarR family transcriptional regulator, organic hydroperoxide resistance regulator
LGKLREGGFLISKINQISSRIFDKMLKEYRIEDLNTAQGRIIFSLWQKDNIAIAELSRQTALGKTSLTSMLDRLEQSGHIYRKQDENDKRKIIISLTAKSKSVKSRYEAVSQEMTRLFYKGVPERQIDGFEGTLKLILENMTAYEEGNK